MYISLYRRYRPQSFSDVVGQSAAIGVVTRAIDNGTIGHAYLFSGPRGCGKTTIARLFAKAVNCPNRKGAEPCNQCETCRSIVEGSCLDVIEIDGASNNSVDEIRDLKEHVALASFTCPYKVYIIDEVHMLSLSAFNALLKTLEEPPERVIFILATTAPHKVPVTIRSRCQHIPFHGMTPEQIVSRLQTVATAEGIEVQNEALWEIARNSEGGMRDALSLMEQAIAYGTGEITRETIDKLLGGGSSSSIRSWLSLCHEKPAEALPNLENLFRSGAVPERFLSVLFTCIRNLWLQSRWGERVLSSLMLSEEERNWLKNEQPFFSSQHLERLMALIASLLPQVRRGISNDVLCGLLVSWLMIPESMPLNELTSVDTLGVGAKTATVSKDSVSQASVESGDTSCAEQKVLPTNVSLTETAQQTVNSAESEHNLKSAVRPDLVGLSVGDDNLKDALVCELDHAPQSVLPLLLSDIAYDRDQKIVSLCLDEKDTLAFEVLKDGRVLDIVRNDLQKLDFNVRTICLFCGEQSKVYTEFSEHREQNPANDPLPQSHSVNNVIDAGFLPSSPNNNSFAAPETQNATFKSSAQSIEHSQTGRASLPDFLSGIMEASLLYCRPNEEGDDSSERSEE